MAVWPVLGFKPGANISNPFGGRQIKTAGYGDIGSNVNNGMDIAVPAGTPIVAPESGTVVSVGTGRNSGWGNSVLLRDLSGALHRLSHMRDVPLVKSGQQIKAGQQLGFVGMTGNATGPHVDYEYKPASGGFANPLTQEFTMAASADIPEDVSRVPGNPGSGSPPPPPGGPPGGDDRNKSTRDRIIDRMEAIQKAIAGAAPDEKAFIQSKLEPELTNLLQSLAALERDTTGRARDDAAQALDRAQAAASAAGVDLRRAEIEAGNARAAAGEATQRYGVDVQASTSLANAATAAATSRYGTDVDAATSRANNQESNATQRYGYDLSAAQAAANLEWDKEQARILQAFNEKKLSWEQAVAAATETRGRLELELTQQRNAIEAASLDVSQRGQDLTSQVTQRGQDIDAGVATRGQDIGRLNQALQSGSSLLGQAMSTAGSIGNATGQTALGALPFYAPSGTGQYHADLLAGRPATAPASTPMPFDPLTIVQQAANAAYARFAPPGQALIAQGSGPSPAFVAPGQIAAPPRVASGYAPIQMPPPQLRPPGGGGGFVAP